MSTYASAGAPERRRAGLGIAAGGALVLLCAALYLPGLGATPFHSKGEPREALVARTMVEGGLADWVLPHRPGPKGDEIASKPPLFHWLVALVSLPTGRVTEGSARLPSALLATVAVVATAGVAGSLWGRTAGLFAGLALALGHEWVHAATTARVDATLAALVALALLPFVHAWGRGAVAPRPRVERAAWALAGLAVLTKGPVGLVLPVGVLGAAMIAGRDRGYLRGRTWVGGLALAVALALGWYGVAVAVGGEPFVRKQILEENLGRFFASEGELASGHRHPWWYFGPAWLGFFAPWSLVLLGGALALRRDLRAALADGGVRLALVWWVVVVAFFSLSAGKRSVYVLPAYPASALLVGWVVGRLDERGAVPGDRARAAARRLAPVAAALFAVPGALLLADAAGLDVLGLVAPYLHPRDRANLGLVEAFLREREGLLVALCATCAAAGWRFVRDFGEGRVVRALGALAMVSALAFAAVQHGVQPHLAEGRSYPAFGRALDERLRAERPNGPVCMLDDGFIYALWFYVEHPLTVCGAQLAVTSDPPGVPGRAPELVVLSKRAFDTLAPELRATLAPVLPAPEGARGDALLLARHRAPDPAR